MSDIDERIQKLFNVIEKKRGEIESIKNEAYDTNASFSFTGDKATNQINLNTVNDVGVLVKMLGFLINQNAAYSEAAKTLGADTKFDWQGYSFKEWEHDIKLRANRVLIKKKKDELTKMESQLDALVSPEMKRELELAAIEAQLSS